MNAEVWFFLMVAFAIASVVIAAWYCLRAEKHERQAHSSAIDEEYRSLTEEKS